mgnify:CR=1 FL=1
MAYSVTAKIFHWGVAALFAYGIIKQVESNSVLGSVQIRKVTTGSARDYILMATVGALCIFALLVGVNA